MRRTTILLVDDHELFRRGIAALLMQSEEVELLAQARSGDECIQLVTELQPQLVLLDVHLTDMEGHRLCQELLSIQPELGVLAISHSCDQSTILGMLESGAMGYLLKDGSLEEFWLAIRTLSKGGSYFSKEVSAALVAGIQGKKKRKIQPTASRSLQSLTKRELEILQYVAEEFSNREIADQLFISPRTVETHKRNLIQKLKVRNTVGLVKYYLHGAAYFQERSA
ncbi:MAG: response regulator transcription factor [Bacteroidota bacterium]